MKDIFSIDFRDAIRKVVRHELKERYCIKVPKEKEKQFKLQENVNPFQVFGVSLDRVPSKSITDEVYFSVPVFLVDAFDYLSQHYKVEGLFRKSGSVGRQKMLREIVEREGTCCSCDFVQPHDVASVIKQFFRELPDPLITNRLSSAFLKCMTLNSLDEAVSAITLCCLLLPDEHLRVLKYFTKFIAKVACHSIQSKMTLTNLSIVFAPNLMSTAGKDKNSEKSMKETTHIIELLFKNSQLLGMVPDDLFTKAKEMNVEGGFCSSSCDELEVEESGRVGRTLARSDKKRDRSKSITGFLKKNFKPADRNTPRHLRSRSEKTVVKSNSLKVPGNSEGVYARAHTERLPKRRSNSRSEHVPVRKSPRLIKREASHPVISVPIIKTLPHQVIVTPRRHLRPIQNIQGNKITPVEPVKDITKESLPSKFDIKKSKLDSKDVVQSTQASHKLYRSQSTYVYTSSTRDMTATVENKLPQSKISRSTQKPHVRKTRRASSMNRRRERYASGKRRQLPKTPHTPPQELLDFSVMSPSELSEFEDLHMNEKVMNTTPKGTRSLADLRVSSSIPSDDTNRSRSKLKKSVTMRLRDGDERNDVTPNARILLRSTSSTVRKPPTPYTVTPQVGFRRHRPVIGAV